MTTISETIKVGRHQETKYISVVWIVFILQGIPGACINKYFSGLWLLLFLICPGYMIRLF